MPLPQTPPLGWPHTEAEKYQSSLHAPPPPEGTPELPGAGRTGRRGCCGGVVLMLVIVAAVALGVAALVDAIGESEFDPATHAFLDGRPGWEIQGAEYTGENGKAVRLRAWDGERGIGRVAIVEPDVTADSGWSVYPLIAAIPGDRAIEEAFLDAFSRTFSSMGYTYATSVEQVNLVSATQSWRVRYRMWDLDEETWTEEYETWATRDRGTSEWVVGAPELPGAAEESTSTP